MATTAELWAAFLTAAEAYRAKEEAFQEADQAVVAARNAQSAAVTFRDVTLPQQQVDERKAAATVVETTTAATEQSMATAKELSGERYAAESAQAAALNAYQQSLATRPLT